MTMLNSGFFARLCFAPEDGTGGDDTVAPVEEGGLLDEGGGDTVAGSDTVAGADPDLLTDDEEGKEEVEAEAPEPIDMEKLKEALPEGFDLDEESAKAFTSILDSGKSTQDMAADLLKLYADETASFTQQQADQWNGLQKEWKDEAKADPVYGGEKLAQSLANAKSIAKEFGGDEFLNLLKVTGATNHKEMIGFLNKVHAAIPQEGRLVKGAPAQGDTSLANRLFPGS